MGADFLYTTFPKFAVTKKRVDELTKLAKTYIRDDMHELMDTLGCEMCDKNEVIDQFVGAINEMYEKKNKYIFGLRRDVAEIDLADGYNYYITGGMSYGDSPTDAFDVLNVLNNVKFYVPYIYNKIDEYAAIDQKKK